MAPSFGELLKELEAENKAITFNGISFSLSKQIATKFNQQFHTSKLGRHTSSSETRLVTRETKRKSSIFHLKNLGPRAIKYITALFNLSVMTCQIPAIWKTSLIIPIPKPGKDTSVGTLYRPAANVLEALILPTINKYLQPAADDNRYRNGIQPEEAP